MRHEDVSGTDSFTANQADAPSILNANNDVDVILAGHYGPATGNAISGAGTISGSAGADLIAAGQASITAIQGAGGTDTSFSGGKLQIAGEYGVLTINAQGAYSYVRSQGTSDGVSDVFTYTLSSRDGGSDIAQLTIDIGKTATVVQANAVQIVPGTDGIVTLPAGVELSDIHVVGSNLVVDLPDGSQMVIVDGAIFVPQLVLGTVEVPASNLAALLIESEPTPAAGTPQSSGGNFAVPVAPLDPGVDLGDLIAPTELSYTPPEFNDVTNAIEDDKPPLITDLAPSVSGGDVTVDEDDLPAGSDAVKEPLTVGGTFTISAHDGVESLTVGSLNVIVDGVFQGGALVTPLGNTLTITGYDAATGVVSYSYTLGAAETHPSGAGENSLFEDFLVTLTDEDGDVDTDTLSVNIVDDVPTAVDDTVNQSGENAPVTFSVFGNDIFGADGVDTDNSPTVAVTFTQPPAGQGTVSYNPATGQFTFTPAAGQQGSTSFTYTIADGDGDPSTATVTINLAADSAPIVTNAVAAVDDDGLPGGNAASIIGDLDANAGEVPLSASEAVYNGTFVADFGSDTPGTFSLAAMHGTSGSVGTETANYAWDAGSNTLTATGPRGILFDVSVDPATGAYTVTLRDNVLHAAGGDENDATAALTFTATDSDGESTNGTLTITFDDDAPTAANGVAAVDDDGLAGGNAASVIGDLDANAGEAAPANPSEAIFHGQLVASGGADAIANYSFVAMHGTSATVGIETVTYAWDAATNTLTATGPRGTLFNVVVNSATGEYDLSLLDNVLHVAAGAGNPAASNENNATTNLIFTVTDGDGDPANGSLTITFDDDMTSSFSPVDLIDTTGATVTTQDDALVNDGTANVTRLINDADNDGVGENFMGADGFGSLVFTDGTDGNPLRSDGGAPLTSGGAAIFVFGYGTGILTATTDVTNTNPASVVFTATLNPNGGFGSASTYTIDFNQAIDDGSSLDLTLGVAATDADGDTVTGAIDITLVPAGTDASVAAQSSSQAPEQEKTATNTNTVVLAAAVGAAGMVATSAAANDELGGDEDWAMSPEIAQAQLLEDSGSTGSEATAGLALDGETSELLGNETAETSTGAGSFGDEPAGGHSLTATSDASPAAQPADLLAATDAPANQSVASIVAPMVSMPSAEALIAAKLERAPSEESQDSAIVGKVLVDALEGGEAEASLDALLEALPAQGLGENAAVEALASQPDGAASAWDMGNSGGLPANANFTLEAMTLHHDAVQPVANG